MLAMIRLRPLAAIGCLLTCAQTPAPGAYHVGEVWQYHTRPQDRGSRVKIQRIEVDPAYPAAGPVYHISIVGLHLRNPRVQGLLTHAAVSRQTLDASLTVPSRSKPHFPSANDGIARWKKARGGVFTISLRDIVDIVDQQTKPMRK
jgi:hypothetical protein